MKLRKMVFGLASIEQWGAGLKRNLKRAVTDKPIPHRDALCFNSAAALRNFFSDRRLELLRAIRQYQPHSIKELAERVHRDFKNVNAEVHYLERLGLIELERESGSGTKGRKAPRALCDEIELRIPL